MNIFKHYQQLIKFCFQGNRGYVASRSYLAEVLISELEEFVDLRGKKVLDVGGERGEFCQALAQKKQCQAINLEPKKLDFVWKTVFGQADNLPFRDKSFDVVLLRGVLQHIPTTKKEKSLWEIHRVLKDGGLLYLMIPPWFSPLSGQDIKPFQYFPFKMARHLRNSIFDSYIQANSLAELGLWPMTFYSTKKLIKKTNFRILKTIDILFRLHLLTRLPIVRELLPSVGFIARKV